MIAFIGHLILDCNNQLVIIKTNLNIGVPLVGTHLHGLELFWKELDSTKERGDKVKREDNIKL